MIKIILHNSAYDMMLNCINVCNFLNNNNYECIVYGLDYPLISACKIGEINEFSPCLGDIIIVDNLKLSKKNMNFFDLVLKQYPIKANRIDYKITRLFTMLKDNISLFFKFGYLTEFALLSSALLPVIDAEGSVIPKRNKIAGIFSCISRSGNILAAIRQAASDGMNEICLFGIIRDPHYFYKEVRPVLESFDGRVNRVKYYGCMYDKNKMYSKISDVYEYSNDRILAYWEMECINNNLTLHTNFVLNYSKIEPGDLMKIISNA
jgi:hypothetical protein